MSYKQMTGNIISATKDYVRGDNWPNAANPLPRGLFAGGVTTGNSPHNVIQTIAIDSLGNASDFGDLSAANNALASVASKTRAVFGGGNNGSSVSFNVMEYVTILTSGNVTDFGDLTLQRFNLGGAGNNTRGIFFAGWNSQADAIQNIIDYR